MEKCTVPCTYCNELTGECIDECIPPCTECNGEHCINACPEGTSGCYYGDGQCVCYDPGDPVCTWCSPTGPSPVEVVDVGPHDICCEGRFDYFTVETIPLSAVSRVTWSWTGGGSGMPYSSNTYSIDFNSCGTQTVTASIDDCDTSKSTQINVCCEDECCNTAPVGPPGCIKKCNPDAPCYFQWPDVETPYTGCQSGNPTDLSCPGDLAGSICAWVAESYYLTSAECASCAPNCARNLVGYCVKLTPWKCNNDFMPTLGFVCVCNADDAGEPHDAGPHYTCLE